MTTPVVTLDAIEAVLPKLDRKRKNPMHNGGCLYTSTRNPKHHCIVGQIWNELGLPVPGPEVQNDVYRAAQLSGTLALHSPEAITALDRLQYRADDLSASGRSWAGAIDAWPSIRRTVEQ